MTVVPIRPLKFGILISHVFPGIFLALSIFMLLEWLSPKDLTGLVVSKLEIFVATIGGLESARSNLLSCFRTNIPLFFLFRP